MKCVIRAKSLAWCGSKLLDLRRRSETFSHILAESQLFFVDGQSTLMLHAVW